MNIIIEKVHEKPIEPFYVIKNRHVERIAYKM